MSAEFKRKVFEKMNGRCYYCGNQITIDNMTVDHVVPKSKGGSLSIHNCSPSCKRCNELKANGTIKEMRDKIEDSLSALRKNREFQVLKKYGVVEISPKPVVFYFELLAM